ncbi:MAG: hypothetical protein Q9201_002982 [Fulgogasparrea decipioides]
MDRLICVIDAATLVESIQQIKQYIYQDRVRLVVPQCTSASIEPVYEKLKEEANKKPLRQPEPQRPRSGGRSTRTEHPAFDINPLVAGEFLARLRSDVGQSGVEFQKDGEQYSPWKILELEEESRSATESKPTTFAQAVQKQNIGRLLGSAGAANGPLKPRLVARSAGVDGSTWKTNNKALSLSISEVPKDIRPLLSCVLWRLHEKGVTRWDTDRTVLVCDNDQTTALAKKLGITTKSMQELRRFCSTPAKESRETSGNLEEDFGIQISATVQPLNNNAEDGPQASLSLAIDQSSKNEVDEGHAPEPIASSPPSSASTKDTGSISSDKSWKSDKKSVGLDEAKSQSTSKRAEKCNVPEQEVDGLPEAPPAEPPSGSEIRQPSTGAQKDTSNEVISDKDQASAQPTAQPTRRASNTLDLEKENAIAEWVRGLTAAAKSGDLTGRDSPMSGHSSTVEATAQQSEPAKDFKPLTYRQAVTGKADEAVKKPMPPPPKEIIPSPRVTPARDPSPPKLEDPEDSDEEIVVFNPKAKRLSAQKAQQSQRPQTPAASPKVSHVRNASGGRPHSRSGNQRQLRPGPPPVVIDPDSFGRNLPANPQPNVQRTFNPYGAHGRSTHAHRGNHRPHNPRPYIQGTPTKTNGASAVNGVGDHNINLPAERVPAPSALANVPLASEIEAAAPVTPPQVLKPSPMVNGSSSDVPPSGPSSGVTGSGSLTDAALRPERPRYSPRGSPRRTPITPEPDVGYILRSGQPREATRGRGKLWVP